MGGQKSEIHKRAEAFVDQLLTEEALQKPSDNVKKPEELVVKLPPWFDEELFNRGRKYYQSQKFGFYAGMLFGLVAVFAVPSILNVLVGSRRSSSAYTAYKRYVSTFLHVNSWFGHELKPGSKSWKSLYTVRSRHLKAGLASRVKGGDYVSQRDIALTLFGFVGFPFLKPDKLGIRQLEDGNWEGINHCWRVIGYMIGLEDRYNICRDSFEESRQVCQLILDRVYTPCLENVPENFEHMTRVMLDGMWSVNPTLDTEAVIYFTKYLGDVPGYIYTEQERIDFQNVIRELEKKPDAGVDSETLMPAADWKAIGPLPKIPPRVFHAKDFAAVETTPFYKPLNLKTRYRMAVSHVAVAFYTTFIGRFYMNMFFTFNLLVAEYFPVIGFIRYGLKEAMVNMFVEDPLDDTQPIPNEKYYNRPKEPWYKVFISWLY